MAAKPISTANLRRSLYAVAVLVFALATVQTVILTLRDRAYATEEASRQRRSEAKLTAAVLEGNLQRLSDVATSLSTRVAFRDHVSAGNWDEAVAILGTVTTDIPDIERVFITDKNGVLKADYPALPGVRGVDFAYRDWYKGVSAGWKAYVSNVYVRTAEPRIKVVAVAVPVRDRVSTEVTGIIVLQVPLENIYDWTGSFDFGNGSDVHFVDREGQLASESDLYGHEHDALSHDEAVMHALRGETGTIVRSDETGERELLAYSTVGTFGWGVVISQPMSVILARQTAQTVGNVATTAVLLALFLAFVVVVSRILRQAELARQMQTFAIDSAGDGIVGIDREWNITLWNPAASAITGWAMEDALGQPLRRVLRLVRRKERTENVLFIADAMMHGTVQHMQDDTLLIRHDGSEVDVADSAAPIINEHGKVIGAVVVFRDVSREREADRSKNDLVSMVIHELRGPATSLKGLIEQFAERWGKGMESAQRVHLRKMNDANDKMLELASSLVNAFSSEYEMSSIEPEPMDISAMADAALEAAQPLLNGRKLHLEKHVDSDVPAMPLDRSLTEMMFSALLSNAIKFTPDGGTVVLEVRQANGNVLVSVTDTGVGVPPNETSRVFTRFYRATNARGTGGVGMGLFVLRALLERAGCRISFQSQLGKGSTFVVAIPRAGMRHYDRNDVG